jgi:tryptophan synthase alpha chain
VIIQEASQRALKRGATLPAVLDLVRSARQRTEIPIVLFGYYNPVFSFGNEAFAREAGEAGVDGLLVVDLPPEESSELRRYTDPRGLDFISLVAPTTPDGRIAWIAGKSSGFLYYISMTGITGTGKPDPSGVEKDLKRIRKATRLPVMVGFGISTPGQAAEMASSSDGVVVGSALVRLIHENRERGDMVEKACEYASLMKKALSQPKKA